MSISKRHSPLLADYAEGLVERAELARVDEMAGELPTVSDEEIHIDMVKCVDS